DKALAWRAAQTTPAVLLSATAGSALFEDSHQRMMEESKHSIDCRDPELALAAAAPFFDSRSKAVNCLTAAPISATLIASLGTSTREICSGAIPIFARAATGSGSSITLKP